jgi:hypothetical protein
MKKLCKFGWDYGRQGYVEGLFFAEKEEIEELYGKTIDFGEILGKHSEVCNTLDEGDVEFIDLPEDVITLLIEKLGEDISGYNPLNYYYGEEE